MQPPSFPTPSSSPKEKRAMHRWRPILTLRPHVWHGWLVVGVALLLRLLWLGDKPAHFDEGVNGWFIDQMTKTGLFRYDPGNYHGPFHFYVLFLAQTLLGRSAWALRLPMILVSTATVWLMLQYRRFLPWRVCLLAAWGMALSTGMLFYSRYAIHEAWLVFAMVLGFWGVAELWRYGTRRGLWAVSMAVTLMVLTKETYIIHLVAFGLACGTLKILEIFSPSQPAAQSPHREWEWRDLGNSISVGVLLILFFYSGGFLDFTILKGLYETFSKWVTTGVNGESGHEKEWYYWLELIARFEWVSLVGLLFCLRALFPGMNRLLRLLAIYGGGVLVAYSIVAYKTPWCIISIIWPFLFLFGAAISALSHWRLPIPMRLAAPLLGGVLLFGTLLQSVDLNYLRPTDPDHPYVYVQTLPDIDDLMLPLKELRAIDPTTPHMIGHIILSSYHPIPWLLGDFTAVGYYDAADRTPSVMDAGFIVVEDSRVNEVEEALRQSYFVSPFSLRGSMSPGRIYLNTRYFQPVFPDREPDFEGAAPAPAPSAPPVP